MNKFLISLCIDQTEEEDGYNGTVVSMVNSTNNSFILFFPIDPEYARLINVILNKEEALKTDHHVLSVYNAMINSWRVCDRYLSGIIMDMEYDYDSEEEIVSPTLIINDSMGNVDALFKINFVQSVILAAIEKKEILVTNELLQNLLPGVEDEEESEAAEDEKVKFPIDKQILDIAKDIMTGKEKEPKKDPTPIKEPKASPTPRKKKT